MKTYSDYYREALSTSTKITEDQAISIANSMYHAERMAEAVTSAIKSIENRLFEDRQGYKGLQTLISEAATMCKRIGR